MNEPLFSLIIPLWNVAPYLPALWESLTGQDLHKAEIIFIDDGSPDDSAERIRQLQALWLRDHPDRISPFRLLTQTNSGVGVARNAGLAQARGRYVWFIDSDDFLAPDALDKLTQAVEAYPSADCFFFPFVQVREEAAKLSQGPNDMSWQKDTAFALHLPTHQLLNSYDCLFLQQPAPWNKIYKRTFLMRNERVRFARYLWYEDLQFFALLLAAKPTWVALDTPLYAYRLRRGSTMQNPSDERNFDIQQILANIRRFYEEAQLEQAFFVGLEAMEAYHGYLVPLTRFIKANAGRGEKKRLRAWQQKNCPTYRQNPLLSSKQKLLGLLYDWHCDFLVKWLV